MVAARLRQPLYSWYVPLWSAMRRWMSGEDEGARVALEEAAAIGHEAGSENAALLTVNIDWFMRIDRGDVRMTAAEVDELGRHLRHSIRTGTFCSYEPEVPVTWEV